VGLLPSLSSTHRVHQGARSITAALARATAAMKYTAEGVVGQLAGFPKCALTELTEWQALAGAGLARVAGHGDRIRRTLPETLPDLA
jgi:hypothetical protein